MVPNGTLLMYRIPIQFCIYMCSFFWHKVFNTIVGRNLCMYICIHAFLPILQPHQSAVGAPKGSFYVHIQRNTDTQVYIGLHTYM